eukprot:SAG22_NODE_1046_length_5865_cov_4.719910_7_plen_233_part_00
MVSCSSDQTVKLWAGADRGHTHLSTLYGHTDYVKALAYSPDTKQVASCSLDRSILIWDLETALKAQALDDPVPALLDGHLESVYAIGMGRAGTVIVSGSTEPDLRLWDPRGGGKCVASLRGHTDHVRTVVVNSEGTMCASGSSDGTVRGPGVRTPGPRNSGPLPLRMPSKSFPVCVLDHAAADLGPGAAAVRAHVPAAQWRLGVGNDGDEGFPRDRVGRPGWQCVRDPGGAQ